MYRILSLFLILVGFTSNQAIALTTQQLDLNFAKSLKFYNGKSYQGAIELLEQNIKDSTYHHESYILLSKIYVEKSQHLFAIRNLYQALEKLHKKDWLLLKLNELDQITMQPHSNANRILEYLCEIYSDYYDVKRTEFDKTDKIKFKRYQNILNTIYTNTKKYFLINIKQKYNIDKNHYSLALLERKTNHPINARQHFQLAKKSIHENVSETIEVNKINKDQLAFEKKIDLYLAESLLKEGHQTQAISYYQSINQTSQNNPIQKISNAYLNSISKSSFQGGVSLLTGYDSNPAFLPNDINNSSSSSFEKSFYLNYLSEIQNQKRFTFNADFIDINYQASPSSDQRQYGFFTDMKMYTQNDKVVTLGLSYRKIFEKNKFSQYESSQTPLKINASLSHIWTYGYTSYNASLGQTALKTQNQNNIELSANHLFYALNRWVHPSVAIKYASYTDASNDGVPAYSENRFEVTNQFYIHEHWSPYLSFYYSQLSSASDLMNQSEWAIQHLSLYSLDKILKGLVARGEIIMQTNQSASNTTQTGVLLYKLGLNLNF